MNTVTKLVAGATLGVVVGLPAAPALAAPTIAVWFGGGTCAGNGICGTLTADFGAGAWTTVTSADLATAGFLAANGFKALISTRSDASFGSGMTAAAAANVTAYVGAAGDPSQGAVAVFTNDAADNLVGGSDPFDANLNALFLNAVTFAVNSGHGYVGEFNGAVMAMTSNTAGFNALGLLSGTAAAVTGYGPKFVYDVGPIGSGNAIDAGVTFPFTDADTSTFLTHITNALPGNIVDIYTSSGIVGLPAVLANSVAINNGPPPTGSPEPASLALLGAGLTGLAAARRRRKK
jgi:hypothetical protein